MSNGMNGSMKGESPEAEEQQDEVVISDVTGAELDTVLKSLFTAPGASHNFKIGVLALAYRLASIPEMRKELLIGMIHIQAQVVTTQLEESGKLAQSVQKAIGASDEEVKEAGKKVDELYKSMKGAEPTPE